MRMLGAKHVYIGKRVMILDGLRMEAVTRWASKRYDPQIVFQDDITVGQNCHITAASKITIGNNVSILPQVLITDIEHSYEVDRPLTQTGLFVGHVAIDDFAVIGMGARILGSKGVHIGKNAVIGTNAVVTKDVPERAIVAGAPARIIGYVGQKQKE